VQLKAKETSPASSIGERRKKKKNKRRGERNIQHESCNEPERKGRKSRKLHKDRKKRKDEFDKKIRANTEDKKKTEKTVKRNLVSSKNW